jgi:hypothetical protein
MIALDAEKGKKIQIFSLLFGFFFGRNEKKKSQGQEIMMRKIEE